MFRARKGAIAVMSAMMITVFMMLTAIAVDYSRLQHMKTQLKTAADAAALAGAIQLMKVRPEYADSAQVYGQRNLVHGVAPLLAFADIRYGKWDDIAGTLDTSAAVTLDDADAVKVTARTPGSYLLARIFGTTPGELVTTSVAWGGGSVGATTCMKPWALPYSALLYKLGHDPFDPTHELTEDDIAMLLSWTAEEDWLNIKLSSPGNNQNQDGVIYDEGDTDRPIPGNFYAVRLPPIADANGNFLGNPDPGGNAYQNNIGGCFDEMIHVGAYLQIEQGNKVGPTGQGIAELCNQAGPSQCTSQGLNSTFIEPYMIKAAIWSSQTSQFGGVDAVRIKYIGGFALMAYRHPGEVYGYFTSFGDPSGSFSAMPGPLSKIILVK